MTFQKGHIPYFSFKGQHHSVKTKVAMRKKRKLWLKTNSLPWTDKKITKSHSKALGIAQKKRFSDIKNHPRWKGGKIMNNGYIMLYRPNHPFKDNHNYVMEHRLVVEKVIGRFLQSGERVHHINRIKTDNRKENLMLFSDEAQHQKYHHKIKNQFQPPCL